MNLTQANSISVVQFTYIIFNLHKIMIYTSDHIKFDLVTRVRTVEAAHPSVSPVRSVYRGHGQSTRTVCLTVGYYSLLVVGTN